MSSIGPGGLGFSPLVSSIAGISQRGDPDRANAVAGEAKFQLDQQQLTEKLVGDVGTSDQTGDRDADGRMAWSFADPQQTELPAADAAETENPVPFHRPVDPDGALGSQLDLEA